MVKVLLDLGLIAVWTSNMLADLIAGVLLVLARLKLGQVVLAKKWSMSKKDLR